MAVDTRYVTHDKWTSLVATEVTYPDGRQVASGYDALYRRNAVTEVSGGASIAAWQFFGNRTATMALGNGITSSFMNNAQTNSAVQSSVALPAWGDKTTDRLGYDGSGRLIAKRFLPSGSTTALVGFTTAYDPSSNKLFERALHAESRSSLYQPRKTRMRICQCGRQRSANNHKSEFHMRGLFLAISILFAALAFARQGELGVSMGAIEDNRLHGLLEDVNQLETQTGIQRIWRDVSNNVTSIWLSPAVATDDNVKLLVGLTELQNINISCPPLSKQLSPATVRKLKQLPKLQQLDLRQAATVISPELSAALGELPNLESLSISYSEISKEAIAPLKKLDRLHCLRITNNNIVGDQHVKAISAVLDSLVELDLSYTQVTDSCLEDIRRMRNLKTLVIIQTKISTSGLHASQLQETIHVVSKSDSSATTQPWRPQAYNEKVRPSIGQ